MKQTWKQGGFQHKPKITKSTWWGYDGCIGYKKMYGNIHSILECFGFDFNDILWYYPAKHYNLIDTQRKVVHWIISASGIPVADTTVQHIRHILINLISGWIPDCMILISSYHQWLILSERHWDVIARGFSIWGQCNHPNPGGVYE